MARKGSKSRKIKTGVDGGVGFSTVTDKEVASMAGVINTVLAGDELVDDFNPILPVSSESIPAFCESFKDGRLLVALADKALVGPELLDVDRVQKQLRRAAKVPEGQQVSAARRSHLEAMENIKMAIEVCEYEGLSTVNVSVDAFREGNAKVVLGLLTQLVALAFLESTLLEFPLEVLRLRGAGEGLAYFWDSKPDEKLLRWLNWHITEDAAAKRTTPKLCDNLGQDLRDCVPYNTLLGRLDPKLQPALEQDLSTRAEHMLANVREMGVGHIFVPPRDIVHGKKRVNTALLMQIYNFNSGLAPMTHEELCALYHEAKARDVQPVLELLRQRGIDGSTAGAPPPVVQVPPPVVEVVVAPPEPALDRAGPDSGAGGGVHAELPAVTVKLPEAAKKVIVDDEEEGYAVDDQGGFSCFCCAMRDIACFRKDYD